MKWPKTISAAGVVLGLLLAVSSAQAQRDCPQAQLLSPVGANVLAPTYLDLDSKFNFAQDMGSCWDARRVSTRSASQGDSMRSFEALGR